MNDNFMITCWCGVPQKFLCEERIVEAKEAGINVLTGEYDREHMRLALDLCQKHGIKLIVIDERINEAMRNPEQRTALITEVTNDWKTHPALHSYYLIDEPGADMFGLLAEMKEEFEKFDAVHPVYINLFPNYACREQLKTDTYEEHVAMFTEKVKPFLLSWDHYHLLNEVPAEAKIDFASQRDADIYYDAQKRTERPGFYDNLEICRKYGLLHDIPYMLIILLVEHGPYRYLSRSEILYEAYQALSYGCSALSYFTYWTPDYEPVWKFRNGIISSDGKKCSHYYDVQSINREITAVGNIIAGTKSEAVFHIGEEKESVRQFCGYAGITEISGGNMTAGFFKGEMLLLANKNFDNSIEAKLKTDRKLELFDKKTGEWSYCGGSVYIEAGGGELIRITE